MIVGCMQLTLTLPENTSLKGKRSVVKRVVERVHHKFRVAVAEVATQDDHQCATIGIVCVSNSATQCETALQHVLRFIEGLHVAAEISAVETESVRVL